MKKLGFTLVEVIAVIVIIGIVAVISTSIVINIIESSRMDAFKNSSYSVFKAVDLFESKSIFNTISDDGINVTDEQIELENNTFISGKIIRNDENELEVVFITDGIYCADGEKTKLRIVKGGCYLLDTTAPDDIVIVIDNVRSNSFRAIVEAKDLESGIRDYQYSIDGINYVSSSVNNHTFDKLQMGSTYTLYVKVTNNNDLTSDIVTKQIVTQDITLPTYSIDKTGWQTSKIVTITYPTRQTDFIYEYSINGGFTWTTVSSGITQNVTFNSNGSVIARINDGTNYKTASSYTVSGIDATAPSASISVSSKTTNTITVIASGTDSESGITKYEFSIDGGTYINNGLNTTYTFTGVTTGNHTVRVRTTNGSGLTTESNVLTVSPNDITTPLYSVNKTGWQTQKIVTITYPTRQTGFVYQYSINGGSSWTNVNSGTTANVTFNNNGSVIARIYDGTNYKTASSYTVSQIDNSAPSAGVILSSKTTNTITVIASGTDAESGIIKYEFSIDGGTYINNGTNIIYTFTSVTTGNHSIKVRTTNGSGLTTESTVLTVSPNEISTPTYSIDKTGWQTQKIVTITYPARQTGFVYQYSTNGGSGWIPVSSGTTQNVTFNANGSVIARIYDGTNYKTASSYTVSQVDATAPTSGVILSSKTTNTLTVIANGTDSESGIVKYEFSIDNGAYISNGTVSTYTFTNVTTGNHTVRVRTTNGSGLTTESSVLTVSPNDITVPTYSVNVSGWQRQKIVTITYPARQTGFVYQYSTNGGSSWIPVSSGTTQNVTFNANGSVIARIYDGTNYKTASSYSVSQIDTVAPTLTFSPNGSTSYVFNNDTDVTFADNASGIDESKSKYLWSTSSSTPSESSFTLSAGNGEGIGMVNASGAYYLWILIKDKAGNTTIARSNVFNIDVNTPVISINPTVVNISKGQNYSLLTGVSATDATSGVASIVSSITNTSTLNAGIYTVTYTATDNAGNKSTANRTLNVFITWYRSRSITSATYYGNYSASSSTSYYCPYGYTASGYGSSTTCTKTTSASSTSASSTTTCSSGTYVASVNRCRIYTDSRVYSCPSGYTLNQSGGSCSKTVTTSPSTSSASVSCPSGWTMSSANNCYKNTVTPTPVYSCPNPGPNNDATLSGTRCRISILSYPTCSGGSFISGIGCATVTPNCVAGFCYTIYSASCPSGFSMNSTTKWCYKYDYYDATISSKTCSDGSTYVSSVDRCRTYTSNRVYSCSSGTLSGTTCYTCPSGYSYSSGSCRKTETVLSSVSCPSGWTMSAADNCYQNQADPVTTYSCSSGTLSGTNCYSCSSGYLSGTSCITSTSNLSSTSYSCSSGGTLSGTTCIRNYYNCSTGTLSGTSCYGSWGAWTKTTQTPSSSLDVETEQRTTE